MSKGRVWIFRVLTLFYLAAVAYLCFAHISSPPKVSPDLLGIPTDKIVHFLMFLPFPILVFFSYDRFTDKIWMALAMAVLTFVAGAALAAGTELIQGLTQYRTRDIMDFFADAAALLVSSTIVFAIDTIQILKSEGHEE